MSLTRAELRLRGALRIFTVVFALGTLIFLLPALAISGQAEWIQVGFVVNSVTKVGVLSGLCATAAANVRRFGLLVPLIIVAHVLSVLAAASLLALADTSATFDILGRELTTRAVLLGAIALDGSIGLLFALLYLTARRARYRLQYLSPAGFETLQALGDVLVMGENERLTAEDLARNVDGYLASFHAKRKWLVKVALVGLYLYPLLSFQAPFPALEPEERLPFVRNRFLRDIAGRRMGRIRRKYVQAMIRLAQQAAYLGYYGDPRTFDSVGYVPFSKRPRYAQAIQAVSRQKSRLRVIQPESIDGDKIKADVVVIGSGAGGAIVAHQLAERGRQVLVVERGRHIDPSSLPTHVSEDEVTMLSLLYSDGALQLTRDFRFQILQGSCVGGSTVVNNAVCFDLPDRVLDRWIDPSGQDTGLEKDRLRQSFQDVRRWLRVQEQSNTILQAGGNKFIEGIRHLGLDKDPNRFGIVEANIADCPGSGYCNIGCAYGKKLSMLDTVLPEAQQQFGADFSILPECRAERIVTRDGRAEEILCLLSNGRKVRVSANTVVVAAGAINSSWLLKQSGVGGRLVGRRLAFNMGSPITADFDEELHSYDGLQISHYFEPLPESGFVMETWFNPVATQAVAMPGWFDDHYANMRRYAHMTATGVLVGTEGNARVRRALTGGPEVEYEPTRGDFSKLLEGLKLAGRIYLAAGAIRVMPSTFRFCEFRSELELDRLSELVKDNSDISLGTGHPQGGNAISRDPRKGVVDPSFRVHGFKNLFVCDASVFPSSITVNPQLTVMALAHYAARLID